MTETHLAPLREAGFEDDAILIAVQVIGYFNYINRVADALHVDLEPSMKERSKDAWLAEKGRDWDIDPGP